MKRMWHAVLVLIAAGIIASLPACGSSVAQTETVSKAAFDALVQRVNDLDQALAAVERKLGPRIDNSNKAFAENRVAPYFPIGFTGTGCTGDMYLLKPGYRFGNSPGFGASGARQGFVFSYLPAVALTPEQEANPPYYMVAPNTTATDFTLASYRDGEGGCKALDGVQPPPADQKGYAVVDNDVAVCGVPDDGLPETMWPQGAPTQGTIHDAEYAEVWTPLSCLTLVPTESLPSVEVGD